MSGPNDFSASTAIKSLLDIARGLSFTVWRSMRGSPLFLHIADTEFFWRINVALLFATSFLSFLVTMPAWQAVLVGAVKAVFYALMASHFLSGKGLSKTSAASALGALAGYDVLHLAAAQVLVAIELDAALVKSLLALAFSLAVSAAVFFINKKFNQLPAAVRAQGYRPSQEKPFNRSSTHE